MHQLRWVLCALAFAFATHSASAAIRTLDATKFPASGRVGDHVLFWEKVFDRFSSSQVLIHDADYPFLLVDVVDFREMARKTRESSQTSQDRAALVERYVRRYRQGIESFANLGRRAQRLSKMEGRLFDVYAKYPRHFERLLRGEVQLRTQVGMADEFAKAVKRAEPYLARMEEIFQSYGLPVGLTRLAFVESMFNIHARSKVGASGIWQFMPGTARSYLHINRYIDERNSPLKATRAAAKHLARNYQEVASWPLALTGYNHGLNGVKRAVRAVGSRDLNKIVDDYRSPSFGFASRNFYAEFVAANRVFDRYLSTGRANVQRPSPMSMIRMTRSTTVSELLRKTPLSSHELRAHNPCLKDEAFANSHVSLPDRFELVVPRHLEGTMRTALRRVGSSSSPRLARR